MALSREPMMEEFRAYLLRERIPEPYLPRFEAEAMAFRARFPDTSPYDLDANAVDAHLEDGRRAGQDDRAQRNRRIACEAFIAFLARKRAAARRSSPDLDAPFSEPEPAPPPPPSVQNPASRRGATASASSASAAGAGGARRKPADLRRSPRITFLTKVQVESYGVLRCSDLSTGGMYLETVSAMGVGTRLEARFKLHPNDPDVIKVIVRVAFEHSGMGAGVEFVSITPEDAKRIADFVAASTKRR